MLIKPSNVLIDADIDESGFDSERSGDL